MAASKYKISLGIMICPKIELVWLYNSMTIPTSTELDTIKWVNIYGL